MRATNKGSTVLTANQCFDSTDEESGPQLKVLPAPISIFRNELEHRSNQRIKRVEDVVLAFMILLMIAVPMLLIAAAVKLTSRGPVFFKQRRAGLNGKQFKVFKFRSMTCCEDGSRVTQATKNDQRVTRLGAFLRRTSLDELPQFLNVLMGDMSIVGPRPHALAHDDLYSAKIPTYSLRHSVKPGITGWAQVNGWRGETDTDDKMIKRVEHDLHYIASWSLTLDLWIIIKTALGGANKNAY